ncbi:MAG: hypothetical protein FWH16_05720, partial [Oscillospiraceae bacterium]|nr:hypothetical protein [Oscillospiraceae bacterium]
MNRKQRRSKFARAALALVVAGTLAAGAVSELYAEAAELPGDLTIQGGGGGGGTDATGISPNGGGGGGYIEYKDDEVFYFVFGGGG